MYSHNCQRTIDASQRSPMIQCGLRSTHLRAETSSIIIVSRLFMTHRVDKGCKAVLAQETSQLRHLEPQMNAVDC